MKQRPADGWMRVVWLAPLVALVATETFGMPWGPLRSTLVISSPWLVALGWLGVRAWRRGRQFSRPPEAVAGLQ
jgi:hypothetical protein